MLATVRDQSEREALAAIDRTNALTLPEESGAGRQPDMLADHVALNVATREDLEAWTAWLDTLGIKHSGIRDGDEPFAFATVVFRDPDNIQLELFAVV